MTLTWYGHSCFKLTSACGSVVFDPYAPGKVPGWTLPELSADLVVCSHDHADHNWAAGVKPSGGAFSGELVRVPSYHDKLRGALRGKNTITLVEAEGVRVVHMGDIGCALTKEQLAALGRVDLLLIPVGGHYTVDAAEAREIADALGAPIVIPMHYRGEGFGYDVIATVEPFLRLLRNVREIAGTSWEVDLSAAPATLVFRP